MAFGPDGGFGDSVGGDMGGLGDISVFIFYEHIPLCFDYAVHLLQMSFSLHSYR